MGHQVIYSDHYEWQPDQYHHGDFPYDDLYFESYHYQSHDNRVLPPLPIYQEEDLSYFTPYGGMSMRRAGCWVRTYVRGMGYRKTQCEMGETFMRNKCFSACKDGYTGIDGTCYANCEASDSEQHHGVHSAHSTTPFCHRPHNYGRASTTRAQPGFEKIGLKYFQPCKEGFKTKGSQCLGMCPEGTKDAGWLGCKKQTYQRTAKQPTCPARTEMSTTKRSCYDECPYGTRGKGPFCLGGCPAHTRSCFGVLCLPAGQSCSTLWGDLSSRVQKVIDAGM